ncbi:MAG: sulfatase-like hydrolase/transferase [Nitrospina sp.]|nr:sulfatase-like hydrolase/transferase [Nitrospina sp.]
MNNHIIKNFYLTGSFMGVHRKIFFHTFVLAVLALAPLYDVLVADPLFILAHSAELTNFIVLIGVVSFGFPLVIATSVTSVLCFSDRHQTLVIRIIIFLLASLVLLPVVKRMTGGNVLNTSIVITFLGVFFSFVYVKYSGPKLFLTYISPVIFVFPFLFVITFPTSVLSTSYEPRKNYPKVSIAKGTPVIFVLLDEFPLSAILNHDLLIDKSSFPNFKRISNQFHWFRNTSANYDHTKNALIGMLTGLDHKINEIGSYKKFPNNLFTLLGYDYQVEAHESSLSDLCPPHICSEQQDTRSFRPYLMDVLAIYFNIVLPRPISFGVPDISQSYKNFWDQSEGIEMWMKNPFVKKQFSIPNNHKDFEGKVLAGKEIRFYKFLSKLDSESEKRFYFLHILLPHMPYRFLASGKRYDPLGNYDYIGLNMENPVREVWDKQSWLVKIQYQKFMLQVGFTDFLLGKLLDRLEEKKLLDRALIVLAADHGVNIAVQGVQRGLDPDSLPDIASVPLFIKVPGQTKGTISDLPATLWDILPTLADALDISVPWEMKGHSLLDNFSRTQKRIIYDYKFEPFAVPDDFENFLLGRVKRKYDYFGEFKGWGKFRLQDEDSTAYMDKPVSEFLIEEMVDVQIELDQGLRVEAKINFLPAMVQGRVTGILKQDEWKTLIAVNGVFQASSPIVKINDQTKMLAFLPENAFKEGSNDVEVYLIQKPFERGSKIYKPRLN